MISKIELEVIADITSQDPKLKNKILVKGAKIKKIFNIEDIKIEEYIDFKNGKNVKKFSSVYEGDNYYKINKPYEDLKRVILNQSSPILGFAAKSKRYK